MSKMEQITVVIGDRPGKGQKVAAGVESGIARSSYRARHAAALREVGRCIEAKTPPSAFPILRQRRRGAITAQNKHGYKAKCNMESRSVDEGVTAINEGCNVLPQLHG
ncbi:hypothetical protein KCP75_23615 [Salmonella enterica subsp. enterica]|nr:hypothetical protein KCP75_23615 [Salmonella enterica subsp. enterica]